MLILMRIQVPLSLSLSLSLSLVAHILQGSQIQNPIFVDMRDYYGQVVVNELTSESTGNVVYCSTADSFSSLQGSTIEQTTNGVATFGNFTVTYKPNSSVTLYFDMSSTVERAEYQIYFRSCVVGEIVLSLFGETTICSECSPGSYSLKLNSQVCVPPSPLHSISSSHCRHRIVDCVQIMQYVVVVMSSMFDQDIGD
jgi:hypothetical protein